MRGGGGGGGGGGGRGVLPYTCGPKGHGFQPFWSEIGGKGFAL